MVVETGIRVPTMLPRRRREEVVRVPVRLVLLSGDSALECQWSLYKSEKLYKQDR